MKANIWTAIKMKAVIPLFITIIFISGCGSGAEPPPPVSYTITVKAGVGGAISSTTDLDRVNDPVRFDVRPNRSYTIDTISGCGGSLSGPTRLGEYSYTTQTLTADCTINISFKALGDPLYSDQWHLKNIGQAGSDKNPGKVGEDINVEAVWNGCQENSCRGEGVRIVIVDDGLEIGHEDLKANVVLGKSYDYIDNDTDPSPSVTEPSDEAIHGTSVAGIIAARDSNGVGVVGVAPRAELVSYNYLNAQTVMNESDAMTRDAAQNHVSNNSWGTVDGTGWLMDSPAVWRTAIDTGHRIGRHGLGTIYVWAAGNGYIGSFLGRPFIADNSNYDGYANYRGVIAVGSVTNSGKSSSYSEQGANLLISAPGGEFCDTHAIVTTDITGANGYNSGSSNNDYDDSNYTACFGSTSAAAPMVSGVAALILQANPRLGWRDVHAILARSARKNNPSQSDWKTNGAGLSINHNYGFGVVDAQAAVLLAKKWVNLPSEKKYSTAKKDVNISIGDNDDTSVGSTLNVVSSGINNIEFIEITFRADDHAYSGDLEIILLNQTTGTTSRLAEKHECGGLFGCILPYKNWRFGSTRHLGESADGDWQLIVKDKADGDTGTFQSWKLTFYGT
ncbi:MAG: S8 family serine peptidase [Gammaproteobacteria bacterium]|nr:S8 family serine peptidase [Gammaproteobacteria bacterium]